MSDWFTRWSVCADVPLPDGALVEVKIWLEPRLLLISAVSSGNPADYLEHVYSAAAKLSNSLGISISTCSVFLDLFEVFGAYSQYLYRWDISGDQPSGSIQPISLNSLQPAIASIIQEHLAKRLRCLSGPGLTNDQRIDILAEAIANPGLDRREILRLSERFRRQLSVEVEERTRSASEEYARELMSLGTTSNKTAILVRD